MSSGGYDGLHSSASYGHGDFRRPSGSSLAWIDRDSYYDRRPASPSRRYPAYDGYYAQENNYRPNSYRPEDDGHYYSRSPSPDHYSRWGRPSDVWEAAEPWGNVPDHWEEPVIASVSPVSSSSKARRDPMMATRMFEPSDSWKQNHGDRPLRTDRHIGEPLQPRTPNSYYPATFNGNGNGHPSGDTLRFRDSYPRSDSYRPGPSWNERSRRPSNASPYDSGRLGDHSRRISASASVLSSGSPRRPSPSRGISQAQRSGSRSPHSSSRSVSRSISRGRRSRSREPSKSDRSLSRGRSLVHRLPASSGESSFSSPQKDASNGKYSWDRPTSSSGMVFTAKIPTTSKVLPSSQPLQKSSWTRSGSRSSIASTQASDGSPHPVTAVSSDVKKPASGSVANGEEVAHDIKIEVKPTNIDIAPPVTTIASSVTKPIVTIAPDLETVRDQDSSAQSALTAAAGNVAQPGSAAESQGVQRPSSPSQVAASQLRINNTAKTIPASTEPLSAPANSEPREVSEIDKNGSVPPPLSAQTVPVASCPALVPSLGNPSPKETTLHHDKLMTVVEARREDTSIVLLPTPLPTPPHHTPDSQQLPSSVFPECMPTEAKSFRDALRIVVMTRLLCDRQTRDERINPVLPANQAALKPEDPLSSSQEELIKEVTEGECQDKRAEKFNMIKGSLVERFEARQNALTEKVKRLKEEYVSLHERWLVHCAVLDEQNKPSVTEPEVMQPSGRTTRRTANLGDAVRSDLEMEQIIASLGNDDATDPNHLSLRNLATIPDMISVTRGRIDCIFDDTNHLVRSPSEYYGPRTGIHDWTESEKSIFLDRFAAHPKQFGMIAEHLPNKTAAQCVDYYYLHKKKLIDFRKAVSQYAPNKRKRGRTGKKKGNALLADIRQHDAEVHGEAGSPRSSGRPSRGRKPMPPPDTKEPRKAPSSRRRNQLDLTPSAGSATPTPEPESRRRGGRRIVATPLSRTVSISLDDAEEEATEELSERPAKRAKRGGRKVVKSAAIVADEPSESEGKTVELIEPISRRKPGGSLVQWSDEDKSLFMALLSQYGDDFKRIAASMPNKTTIQVSTYYKANCDVLGLDAVAASAPKRSPTPDAMTDETPGMPTPATEIMDEPIVSLASSSSPQEMDPKATGTMGLPPRQATPPIPTSHVRGGYYPMNGRATAPYYPHPSQPMPAAYGPPVPYSYPAFPAPHYPPYDSSRMPYTTSDSNRHMPIRSRDNPHSAHSPRHGQAPHLYSLETS